MTKVIKILILLFAGIYFRCEANDSVVEVSSSGLVFSQEKNISMVSEKLEISPKEISVQYEFENTSKKEIEVTVASLFLHLESIGLVILSLTHQILVTLK